MADPGTPAGSAGAGDLGFSGLGVVVTGVSQRGQVGEAVAHAFARHGATVHCIARDAGADDRARELRAAGYSAFAHIVDLTDFEATNDVARTIAARHGGAIHAVAAMAGGFASSGPVGESDPRIYAAQHAVNATTAYATARAFAAPVRAGRGAFVFAASAAVLQDGRADTLTAYAMAKGAVVQLVRGFAREERDTGVRVNAIAPLAVRTASNAASAPPDARFVELAEVAECVVALCGPAFARVTGQIVRLA
jgi:NAD(P)-dependent dehydrogenase (short-subunit alcohol dehydrogenase family)